MPLKAPEHYELGGARGPSPRASVEDVFRSSEDSDFSDIDELDPLKPSDRPFSHNASRPRRSVSDLDKPSAFGPRSLTWLGHQRRRVAWTGQLVPRRFGYVLALFSCAGLLLLAGGFWSHRLQVQHHPDFDESEPWYPVPKGGTDEAWAASFRKAADLVKKMTLVEKVNITTGIGWSMGMCVGNTGPVPRLGFPSLCLQDGPLGLRFLDNTTAFPAGITVGATWNRHLMRLRGEAHGYEARLKGINVLLGPSMGPFGRLPAGGRNWEGFGADPVLQGIAAAETIKGIQSMGVIATAKHYVANEQEHFRQADAWGLPEALSSNIDDRAMHEIYAWPFAESVRAGVGSVMCSYNQVNNSYACQNSKLLNGILKDELGFQGFVQSDWLAQRSGVASALAGLDMTMPGDGLIWQDGNTLWGQELTRAVLNASVPIDRLNDMVLRIVAAWYQLGQDNQTLWPSPADGGGPNFSSWTDDDVGLLHPGSPNSHDTGVVNRHVPVRITKESGDHDQLARRIAAEGIVLVKNEDRVLPLLRNASNIHSAGGGKVKIGIFGEDAFLNPAGLNVCPDRGCNDGTLAMGWGSGAVELPYLIEPAQALRTAFDSEFVELSEVRSNNDPDTLNVAAHQDLCLVLINSDAGEGFLTWNGVRGDRNDLYPQKGGDALVQTVATNCGGINSIGVAAKTIVVLHTVGPTILERWIDHPGVKAALIAHLPGQESGNALADVLFAYINPSGRLPYTIAKTEDDYGPTSKILTASEHVVPQQTFTEGLYVDYRYFDQKNITPRYEFGYGRSYSTFELSALTMESTGLNGALPEPRGYDGPKPPNLGYDIPDPETALLPEGFRKLQKYIYPYLDSLESLTVGRYRRPQGYEKWHAPSPAGGGPGGNADLYSVAVRLGVNVTNAGPLPGECVVQVYISYPDNVVDIDGNALEMPVKRLRAFDKVAVGTAPGSSSRRVTFELTRKDLSYWDVKLQNWVMPIGLFRICLGFSSRDLPECHVWEHKLRVDEAHGEDPEELPEDEPSPDTD